MTHRFAAIALPATIARSLPFAWPVVAIATALLAALPALADPAPQVPADYASLAGKKAFAIAIEGDRRASGGSHGESSDLAASKAALDACDAERARLAMTAHCEVIALDDESIDTAAALEARVPKSRHPLFLWRYDAPHAHVYLAGSMHVMKATLLPLPQQFEDAFAESDHIAVEVNVAAVSAVDLQQQLLSAALLPAGQSLDTVLESDTLKKLDAYLADQGLSRLLVARLKPALIATQLSADRFAALGYVSDFGLDKHFIDRAGARPVLELETVADQLALLMSPPMDVQRDMLDATIDEMAESNAILSQMVVAWLAGDSEAMRALFDEQSPQTDAYRAFDKRMLDDRNVGMADKIQGYLAASGTYFVLVGAAHVSGAGSIIDVLDRRGVKGKRIFSTDKLSTDTSSTDHG